MNFTKIRVRDFRNIHHADLLINMGLTVFIGDNAQGKSNFLEVISLLTNGESFRSVNHYTDFIKSDSTSKLCHISGQLLTQKADQQFEHNLEFKISQLGKEFTHNRKRIGRQDLVKKFGLVTFTPESLNIVKSGPVERRKMLDEITQALDLNHIADQIAFSRALKSRNALLRQYRDGAKIDTKLLEAVTENYLPLAAKMTNARITATRQILPFVEKIYRGISLQKNDEIALEYIISDHCAIDWNENKVYDDLLSRLKQLKGAEIASGQTLVGPHKHDVVIRLNRRDARYFCSQGQQRAITLSFKISQIEAFRQSLGETPILILDDVLSELDIDKQKKLIELLSSLEGQIFMSTTNLEHIRLFGNKKYDVYKIINGELKD